MTAPAIIGGRRDGDLGPAPAEQVAAALARLDDLDDHAHEVAETVVAALLRMYEDAVRRLLDLAARGGGAKVADLVDDEVWRGLLCLHGLHPVPLEERVLQALETTRPYLARHGGDVRLAGLDGDVAYLELSGGCDGCAASQQTLRGLIEQAVNAVAPEVATVSLVETTEPRLLQIAPRPPDDAVCPWPETTP